MEIARELPAQNVTGLAFDSVMETEFIRIIAPPKTRIQVEQTIIHNMIVI